MENADLLLRFWRSGIEEYRSIIGIILEGNITLAARKAGVSTEEGLNVALRLWNPEAEVPQIISPQRVERCTGLWKKISFFRL